MSHYHFQAELVYFTSLLESILLNRAVMNPLGRRGGEVIFNAAFLWAFLNLPC